VVAGWGGMLRGLMRPVAWLMLSVYAALLVPLLTDFRAVMGDEACYVDPALRWCEGQGWTSTAWGRPPGEFWASNLPLYAMSVAAWVKVTGLDSLWGLRLWSVILYVSGLALWITGADRAGWLRSSAQQVGFLALMAGSLYATGPSQYARPEALGALLLGFSLWGQTLSSTRLRDGAALASGFLVAWTGLQFAVALAVLGLVWLLLAERRPWRSLFLCGAGGVLGFVALFGVYQSLGVLGVFLEETFGTAGNRMAQWHGWRDPMLWAASAVLIAVLVTRGKNSAEGRRALAGLLGGPGLALVLFALGKFPQYYAFLAILPLATAVCAAVPSIARKWKPVAFALLASAGVIGFPLAALMNWNAMPGRQHADLWRWVESALAGREAVFVDPSAYFAARAEGREVYTQFVLDALSAEELQRIDAVQLMPDHGLAYLGKAEVLAKLGGSWRLVGAYPAAGRPSSRVPQLDFLSRLSYSGPYVFELWERAR
jgi:hypothetical protein